MEPFVDTVTPSYSTYVQDIGAQTKYNDWTYGEKGDMHNQWAQMYYPNAYQAALLNYQNEWASPKNQMLRYQEAGLNPYSIQMQQSANPSSGAAPGPSHMEQNRQGRTQLVLNSIDSLKDQVMAARELYDYINYGRGIAQNQLAISGYQVTAAEAEAASAMSNARWNRYWNEGQGDLKQSPRGQYMDLSTQRISAQMSQLEYVVEHLYPSQEARNKAEAALKIYQNQILSGQNDAILTIDTGYKELDSVLQFLAYMVKDNTKTMLRGLL